MHHCGTVAKQHEGASGAIVSKDLWNDGLWRCTAAYGTTSCTEDVMGCLDRERHYCFLEGNYCT